MKVPKKSVVKITRIKVVETSISYVALSKQPVVRVRVGSEQVCVSGSKTGNVRTRAKAIAPRIIPA